MSSYAYALEQYANIQHSAFLILKQSCNSITQEQTIMTIEITLTGYAVSDLNEASRK